MEGELFLDTIYEENSTKRRIQELEHIKKLLVTHKSPRGDLVFPLATEIKKMGITATQVELSPDETLQFDPCFFLPLSYNGLLQTYAAKDKVKLPHLQLLTSGTSIESYLRSAQMYPDRIHTGNILEELYHWYHVDVESHKEEIERVDSDFLECAMSSALRHARSQLWTYHGYEALTYDKSQDKHIKKRGLEFDESFVDGRDTNPKRRELAFDEGLGGGRGTNTKRRVVAFDENTKHWEGEEEEVGFGYKWISRCLSTKRMARTSNITKELNRKSFNLQQLTHWRCEKRERLKAKDCPDSLDEDYGIEWRVYDFFRYFDPECPKPHIMATMGSSVHDSEEDRGISSAEISTAIGIMIDRVMRTGFINYWVHPILFFSFLGAHHVRIIQATFDGETFTLQYSRLWDYFATGNDSPVKLLLRYYLNQPVGMTRKSESAC